MGAFGDLILEVWNSCYGCCYMSVKGLLSRNGGPLHNRQYEFFLDQNSSNLSLLEAVVVTEIADTGDHVGLTSAGEAWAGVWA